MDPVIAAAIIAASATAVVAIVGLLVNTRSTTQALRASRNLAQDQRLWEKRADTYGEIFAYAGHRKDVRAYRLDPPRPEPGAQAAAKRVLDSYQLPSWYELQGRVLAFSSDEAAAAFIAAHEADDRMWQIWMAHADAVANAAAQPDSLWMGAAATLMRQIGEHRAKADEADSALIGVMRQELQSSPRPTRRRLSPQATRARGDSPYNAQ